MKWPNRGSLLSKGHRASISVMYSYLPTLKYCCQNIQSSTKLQSLIQMILNIFNKAKTKKRNSTHENNLQISLQFQQKHHLKLANQTNLEFHDQTF